MTRTPRPTWRAASLVIALFTIAAPAAAQQPRFNEREVKAVFLFNFVQFVDWPQQAFASAQAPVSICVLGEDPFGTLLEEVVKGEIVKKRPLVIERFRRVQDITTCHVLFISPAESQRYEQILSALRGRPMLTIGETESFTARGGMIRFLTERNRINLEVNVAAAKAAGLILSSNLLRPARIVGGEGIR